MYVLNLFLEGHKLLFHGAFFLIILALCMVSNQEQVMMALLVFESSCLPDLLKL
jgi:uncharacterized integral membrane protein